DKNDPAGISRTAFDIGAYPRQSRGPRPGTPVLSCGSLRRGYGHREGTARCRVSRGGPYVAVCAATAYELSPYKRLSNVKRYSLLLVALAACSQQQRPVVLAPVRMDAPSTGSPGVARQSRAPFATQRDDPFATTNRIDWPGPNRYRSSNGAPGPDYWQQTTEYTINACADTATHD